MWSVITIAALCGALTFVAVSWRVTSVRLAEERTTTAALLRIFDRLESSSPATTTERDLDSAWLQGYEAWGIVSESPNPLCYEHIGYDHRSLGGSEPYGYVYCLLSKSHVGQHRDTHHEKALEDHALDVELRAVHDGETFSVLPLDEV